MTKDIAMIIDRLDKIDNYIRGGDSVPTNTKKEVEEPPQRTLKGVWYDKDLTPKDRGYYFIMSGRMCLGDQFAVGICTEDGIPIKAPWLFHFDSSTSKVTGFNSFNGAVSKELAIPLNKND